jgi:DNA polymerase-3 subunit delta'
MIYKWLIPEWQRLNRHRARLPHALLICGRPGVGKSMLADVFAQSLLCERPAQDGQPCQACDSCNWYALGNHPDFRRLEPESMAADTADDPPARKEKKKSDQIRIEQVRATEGFLAVGTHRGGLRIILIDPAEAMNASAQGALLKNLEEPPPQTLYLLACSRVERLLTTIRSRCLAVPIGIPERATALAWLTGEGISDAPAALAAAAGAPLAAVSAAESESARRAFLSQLADPEADPLAIALACDRLEPALVVGWLQRWVCDLLSARAAGTIRYNLDARDALLRICRTPSAAALAGLMRRLGEARALAQHPLNARLFFEDLLLQYRIVISTAYGRA